MLALALALFVPSSMATEATSRALWLMEVHRAPPMAVASHAISEETTTRQETARALGRLRHSDALATLADLAEDNESAVRTEAAFALGLTPGSRTTVLERLQTETNKEVRAELVAALGQQVEGEDVPLLITLMEESPIVRREAAIALGRLGMKEDLSAQSLEVTDALANGLRSLDVPSRRAAAFALRRIQPTIFGPDIREMLLKIQGSDRDPSVRSLLFRALAPSEPPSGRLVEQALTDSDPMVRSAVAQGIQDAHLDDPAQALAPLVSDPHWSVRLSAVQTLGALEGSVSNELLSAALSDPVPAVVAAALPVLLMTGIEPTPRPWLDASQPLLVRMAAISGLTDTGQIQRILTGAKESALRTAAAQRLMELDTAETSLSILVKDADPTVVSIALDHLQENPEQLPLNEVAPQVTHHHSADVLLSWFDLLESQKELSAGADSIAEARLHPDLAVRLRATELSRELDLPPAPPAAFPEPLPNLNEVLRIRSARIQTDAGELRVTLTPEVAPLAVHQFAQLAESGFYDDLSFHRVVPGFVAQAGCPRGDGWGGPDRLLPAEPSSTRYAPGTLGMADAGWDTAGSQWFLTLSEQPHLEGRYTVFGHLSLQNGVLHRIRPGTRIQAVQIERTSGGSMAEKHPDTDQPGTGR